jgi:hypothetical protein
MTAFGEFWDIASFRSAFTALIRLPESAIQALRSALDEGNLPSSPPEGSGVATDDWLRARSTVRTLAAIRDDDGFAALLGDVGQMMGNSPDSERSIRVVTELLELDPETEQLILIKRTQSAALPVLVSLSVEVDFRAVPSVAADQPTLAPVFIVRLTFDEDISGSAAIVFQVPDDSAEIVLKRLEEARQMRTAIASRLPATLLHDKIRQEISENG